MKRILFMFVGILCSLVTMAADVKDLVAITGDYTLVADNVTSKGTAAIGKSVLFGDSHFLSDAQGLTVATNKGSSTIGEASCLNSLRVKNNVMIAFKVSGACHVKVYHQSNSSRTIIINSEYKLSEGDVVGEYSTTTTEADITSAQTVYVYSIDKDNLSTSGKGDLYIAGIEITFASASYNVTYQNDGNGTLTGAATAKAGATVNVTATPNSGYRFDYITVNDAKQKAGVTSFTMPNEAATVKAYFAEVINVTGVSLDKTSLDMMQYSQATLTATVAPADATIKNVTWASDNEAVATVTDGVVYAKSIGTANITVTTEDGGKTATCAVNVTAIPGEVLFTATPVSDKNLNVKSKAAAVEVTDEYATITGGKVYLYDGHSSSDADMIYASQFNVAASGGSYIKFVLDKALKAGDIITVFDYNGNGVTTANSFILSTSTSKGSTNYTFPYIVTDGSAINGKKEIYLWKSAVSAFKTITVNGEIARTIEVSSSAVSVDKDNTTAEINITGEDLLGSTLTAVLSPEVEGLSVALDNSTITDGAITAKATLTYAPTANDKGTATLTISDGTTTKEVKVTYSALISEVELAHVTEATVWDWKKLHDAIGVDEIKYTDKTDITKTDEFVLANEPKIYPVEASVFNAAALQIVTEYSMRNQSSTYFMQGPSVKFYVEQPGTIKVKFSDTGSRTDETYDRCLAVNGVEMNIASHTATPVESGAIAVPAGLVELTGYFVDKEARNNSNSQYLRIYSIEYTPAAAAASVTLNANGFSTYSNSSDVRIEGAKVYKAKLDLDNNKIVATEIESGIVPAGVGVILVGEAGATVNVYKSANAPAVSDNDLAATTLANGTLVEKESSLVLSGDTFMNYTGVAFTANKAYFPYHASASTAKGGFSIVFGDDNATAVGTVKSQEKTVVAGKFIVNGKLVIVKNNKKYNVAGIEK